MVHKSTMSWNDIQFFLSVARHGSARATAEELGMSHTTVSRRIEKLEASLGTRLFDRDVKGYGLTENGSALLGYVEQAEDMLLSAERHLQGRDTELSGTISVATADVIAYDLLLPELEQFTSTYKDIHIDLRVATTLADLTRREVDVALRFLGHGSQPPDPLVGRKVGSVASCFYATPAYLAQHDPTAANTTAQWIGWGDDRFDNVWIAESPYPQIAKRFMFDHGYLQLKAAKAGMGMTMLPCFLGDSVPELVRISGAQPQLKHEIWLLSHPDQREVTRLRKFREFVVELFQQKELKMLGVLATEDTP